MTQGRSFIYDRVYIIGVDGAGSFFRLTRTPAIDRIFEHGAVSHAVLTAIPTISAQCWGSLLHGVSPQAHRLTNGLVGEQTLGSDYPYRSIFRLVREAFPDAVIASFCGWWPINVGIIEQGLDIINGTGSDEEVCEMACEAIKTADPKLLFVQFDSVDSAGHRFGYGAGGHLDRITGVDALIGRIYDTAAGSVGLDKTLFIVTADHGGSPDGNHGGATDAEKIISFFVAGRSVCAGSFGPAELRDSAAITAFAFGLEQPANWSCRVPDGLFADGVSFERPGEAAPDGTKRYSGRVSRPTPRESGKTLGDFIDASTLLCCLELDGSAVNAAGGDTAVDGKIYYTDGFYGSAAVFDDCTVRLSPVSLGTGDYTFCAWIKLNTVEAAKRLELFWTSEGRGDRGIAFYIKSGRLFSVISTGEKEIEVSEPLPPNYDGNWFHFICSLDRSENELCYYYDFTIYTDTYLFERVPEAAELNGAGASAGGRSPVTLDDVLVFDHKLSDKEIDCLMRYYEQ